MANHYYDQNDSILDSNPKYINFEIDGYNLKFKTDNGVFSKERVDFGTIVLLENFKLSSGSETVIDIGCGYGVIGITLAKRYPSSKICMVDINDRAVKLANENIEMNNLTNVSAHESNLFDGISVDSCDIVVSNPPIRAGKSVVFGIIEGAYKYLKNGGELWFVIQKKQGASSSEKKMRGLFDVVEIVGIKKGYVIIKAKK